MNYACCLRLRRRCELPGRMWWQQCCLCRRQPWGHWVRWREARRFRVLGFLAKEGKLKNGEAKRVVTPSVMKLTLALQGRGRNDGDSARSGWLGGSGRKGLRSDGRDTFEAHGTTTPTCSRRDATFKWRGVRMAMETVVRSRRGGRSSLSSDGDSGCAGRRGRSEPGRKKKTGLLL
ncbi:filamentous hemagglutinin N-terminal domain-containing protein [Sesbania bispinosa]|nr:filamentous hemagglutinin N-terminal domain-containing protein [Sesbania bispinosa]